MKKRSLVIHLFLALILIISLGNIIYADVGTLCDLEVSLINQDPYPAIPGDYVELVFQVDGLANPDCGEITFELKEKFPISFDPLDEPKIIAQGGFYEKNYGSFLIVPYKVRVSEEALDGDNPIEVGFTSTNSNRKLAETKEFNLNIQDVRADFEMFIKDYVPETNTLTLEILNIGDNDVEAITLHVPKQNNIEIKGTNRNIIGDLDSNEYTTADFEAIPENGDIDIEIIYTDTVNTRRSITKQVRFDDSYFDGRVQDKKSYTSTIIIILILFIIGIWFWRRYRKKRKLLHRR